MERRETASVFGTTGDFHMLIALALSLAVLSALVVFIDGEPD
jgi:hypothetical protein